MPFTPPTTYRSTATTGYLAQLLIGDGASPENFVAFLEIKTFSNSPISVPNVNTTHLLSPDSTEELQPGLIMPGKISCGGNFIGDSTQLNISALAQAQTIFNFKVKAPVQSRTKTYTLAGHGFVADYKNGPFENNKTIEFQLDIQMEGAYTEATA